MCGKLPIHYDLKQAAITHMYFHTWRLLVQALPSDVLSILCRLCSVGIPAEREGWWCGPEPSGR